MTDEIMEGLIEAFADENEEPADGADTPDADAELEAAPAADEADEDTGEADDEAAGEDAEKAADEPEGAKYLKLVGPDGKAKRVHIDDLLADTQHDVTVDGEKRFVSYEELRSGYQRQADYTRKTMELSRERGELAPFAQMVAHAKKDPDFVRHVQAYFQHGPAPQLQMAAQLDVPDEQLAQLLDSERPEHVKQAKEILNARAQFRRVMAERQQYDAQAQQEQKRLLETYLEAEREKVVATIPDYPKQVPAIAAALRDVYGFTKQELDSVYDSRLVRLAHDAMLYRRSLEEGNRIGLEGKRKAPPPPKAAKPGAGKAVSAKQVRANKELTQRARRSGSTDDWAAVIANRLGLS